MKLSRRPSHRSPAIVRARNAAIAQAHSRTQSDGAPTLATTSSPPTATETSPSSTTAPPPTPTPPPAAVAAGEASVKQNALNDLATHIRITYPQVAEDHTVQRLLGEIQSGISAAPPAPSASS